MIATATFPLGCPSMSAMGPTLPQAMDSTSYRLGSTATAQCYGKVKFRAEPGPLVRRLAGWTGRYRSRGPPSSGGPVRGPTPEQGRAKPALPSPSYLRASIAGAEAPPRVGQGHPSSANAPLGPSPPSSPRPRQRQGCRKGCTIASTESSGKVPQWVESRLGLPDPDPTWLRRNQAFGTVGRAQVPHGGRPSNNGAARPSRCTYT